MGSVNITRQCTVKFLQLAVRLKLPLTRDICGCSFLQSLVESFMASVQFFQGLGRQDTPQNREWAARIAARIYELAEKI
jgi:hypothetical protein